VFAEFQTSVEGLMLIGVLALDSLLALLPGKM